MSNTHFPSLDAAALKSKVASAMRRGMPLLPFGGSATFKEIDAAAVEQAPHLGAISFEEIQDTRLPPISLRPRDWPALDVTYALIDEHRLSLVWLHLDQGGTRMRVSCFANARHQPALIVPKTLRADGRFLPEITLVGPGASAEGIVDNVVRCALDGGIIMLARHLVAQRAA